MAVLAIPVLSGIDIDVVRAPSIQRPLRYQSSASRLIDQRVHSALRSLHAALGRKIAIVMLTARCPCGELKECNPELSPTHIERMPFIPAGAVTGIGSLPLTSVTSAIRAVAEFSPEVPFWPQLPQLSETGESHRPGLGLRG